MLHDLRYALRTLRQNPGFALVAILSLALGIGANAAMYSFADALLFRPLAVPDAGGIVAVQSQMRGEAITRFAQYLPLSYPDYADLRDKSRSFAGLTAARFASFGFATEKGALPQMKFGELVSGNFFSLLRLEPALGRGFRPEEEQARGRDAVAVLGYDLWKNELAGSSDAIGRTIFLNGIPFTVIGVAPEHFPGSNSIVHSALFVPLMMEPLLSGNSGKTMLDQRDSPQLTVRGRLQPGVSVDQAAAEVAVIGQQLAKAYPATNRTTTFGAASDQRSRVQQNPFDAILVFCLIGLSILVLLIACANVMNLMLSRAGARSREIAVRLAIGAGRGRLIRQLLTESLVIALLGGAAGLFVAQLGADVFSQMKIPSAIPIVIAVQINARVLWMTLIASVASALFCGLVPAIRTANPELVPALKSGKAASGKRRRLIGRNGLVVAQVATSLVLLVLATWSYRGAAMVLATPAGFRTDHLLVASFDPGLARYTPDQAQVFYQRLTERTRGLAGVKSVALAQDVPMGVNGGASRVAPEGVQLPQGAEAALVLSNTVSEGYFETMDIPIVQGRSFARTDRADTPRVAIVNELFARKYFPKGSPVGRRLRVLGPEGGMAQIVGVAKQSKYSFILEPPLDCIYLPAAQAPQTGMTLLVETAGAPGALAGALRDTVRSLDASQPMFGVGTMDDYFDQRSRNMLKVLIQVIAGLAFLGLAIALVGLYGLMTYSVGLRQREIGIRMAIGAQPAGVLRMVLGQGLALAGIGIAVGLVLTALLSSALTAGLSMPTVKISLVALVAAALLVVAAIGALIPARRASLLDPNLVLRQE